MTIQDERVQLRRRYDQLLGEVCSLPQEDWPPLLDEMEGVLERLNHTYFSRWGWRWRALRSWLRRWRDRISFGHDLQEIPPGSRAHTTTSLVVELSQRVLASSRDRVELTPENIASWLGDETRATPEFDPTRCFRALNRAIRKGGVVRTWANGGAWFEADSRERVVIHRARRPEMRRMESADPPA